MSLSYTTYRSLNQFGTFLNKSKTVLESLKKFTWVLKSLTLILFRIIVFAIFQEAR